MKETESVLKPSLTISLIHMRNYLFSEVTGMKNV